MHAFRTYIFAKAYPRCSAICLRCWPICSVNKRLLAGR